MDRELIELRILPPFAIGRLGSSPHPMDCYELTIPDAIAPRKIVPAETLAVDPETGEARLITPPAPVKFRDAEGLIRPVAPFLEVWARFRGQAELQPLTAHVLHDFRLAPKDLQCRAHVANLKIFRRTRDPGDRIEARTPWFRDHSAHELRGESPNFLKGGAVPFGSIRYIAPSSDLPEIRLRFTPAGGHVYGPPPPSGKDPNITAALYDDTKGKWKGYSEPDNTTRAPDKGRFLTNPGQIYAGESAGSKKNSRFVSWGYFDDECDGIVEVKLRVGARTLYAFGRIAAGPPTFAPDSMPVRTVGDELEQAMFGPHVGAVTEIELRETCDIVRRALETVRLMNTGQLNKASLDRGVGMARMDTNNVHRALEPIFEQSVADAVAIRSRHERVLLALESGSLVWFTHALRDYDKVGDLSTDGRRKMPALMRGAEGRYLALTRRQVAKIRAAAEYFVSRQGKGTV